MAHLAPGSLLNGGKYVLVKELNRGGSAVVMEAVQALTGRRVALKVVQPPAERLPGALRTHQREVASAAALSSSGVIAALLDEFTEPGMLVTVWELVEGMDLLDYLNSRGGVLGEAEAAPLFAQLVHGIRLIHEAGLVHRDMKGENVMLEAGTGRIKIIDFGLSKRQQSAVTLGVGTIDYMPPELLGTSGDFSVLKHRQTASYDACAVDVWASGVLLYLFSTGAYPFENPACPQNVVETLKNIARGTYRPLPARLSPQLRDLIQRMLCQDPQQRISLEQVAAHPWLQAHGAAVAAATAHSSAAASPAAPASPVAEAAAEEAQPMEAEAPLPTSFAAPTPATFSFGTQVECKPTPQLVPAAPAAPAAPGTPAAPIACTPLPASPATPDAAAAAAARHGFLGAFTSCWFSRP